MGKLLSWKLMQIIQFGQFICHSRIHGINHINLIVYQLHILGGVLEEYKQTVIS